MSYSKNYATVQNYTWVTSRREAGQILHEHTVERMTKFNTKDYQEAFRMTTQEPELEHLVKLYTAPDGTHWEED